MSREINSLLDTIHESNKNEVFKKFEALKIGQNQQLINDFIEILSGKLETAKLGVIPLYAEICKLLIKHEGFEGKENDVETGILGHIYSKLYELLRFEKVGLVENELTNYVLFIKFLYLNKCVPCSTICSYINKLVEKVSKNPDIPKLCLKLIECAGKEIDILMDKIFIDDWLEKIEKNLNDKTRKIFGDLIELRRNNWKIETTKNEEIENLKNDVDRYRELLAKERQSSDSKSEEISNLKKSLEEFDIQIKHPEVRKIYEDYRKCLKNGELQFPLETCISRINRSLEINPNSIENLTRKAEALKLKEKIDECIGRVSQDFWKIQNNPDISIDDLDQELIMRNNTFFDKDFQERYSILVFEEENPLLCVIL